MNRLSTWIAKLWKKARSHRAFRSARGDYILIFIGLVFLSAAALPALVHIGSSTSASEMASDARVASLASSAAPMDPVPDSGKRETTIPEALVEWVRQAEFDVAEAAVLEETAAMEFDCMVEPWEEILIRSTVIGRIDAINVERADVVEAGDLLLELDVDLARADLELARKRADMVASVRSLEVRQSLGARREGRAVELYSQNALALDAKDEILTEKEIATYDLEDARDRHALAKLQLTRERARYERRRIRSPVTGIVADRLMTVGEVVDDEVVLKIAQIDPLRVEVILPAIEFGNIHRGMKAAVTPEIPGDKVLVATVHLVDRIIDSASGTFGAQLELPNPNHEIPAGLRCRVQFMDVSVEQDELARAEPIEP